MTIFLKVKNNAVSTLSVGIDNAATVFPVADITKYPDEYPFHASVEAEIVSVAGKVGSNLDPCTRAQEGTSPAAHVAGVSVEQLFTAQQVTDIHDAVNTLEDDVIAVYIPFGTEESYAP